MIHIQKSELQNPHVRPNVKITLKIKMILLISVLIIGVITVLGFFIHYFISDTLEKQMGERAQSVAESVAQIPELREAFKLEDPSAFIQSIVTPIQEATGAEFIVIGNQEEIRYTHPEVEKIGKKMIGEDNERALRYGESYVSKATGSLGNSLRAKVPIILDGEIVGVASVGFLVDDIQSIIRNYSKELWYILLIISVVAVLGAVYLASYIKKMLFGLEPEEIAYLYFQKEKILQSTHEGILAVDQNGIITMMNAAAEKLVDGQDPVNNAYLGKSIDSVLPFSEIPEVLQDGKSRYNREMILGKYVVYVNIVPIYIEKAMMGVVATVRNKTDIEVLTNELTRVQQYTNALRAQTHEFSNKLHTILGLLLLGKPKEAIGFIQLEKNIQQEWIRVLIDKVSDPLISGILIGKLNVANELQIDLSIHPDSKLETRLADVKSEALLTALGNLLENAIDAVKDQVLSNRKISIFFTDVGDDIIFEIEDSGVGIPDELVKFIFNQGFSLKEGENRGIGLALTKQLIENVNGALYLEEGELGGACFVISIPKEERGD